MAPQAAFLCLQGPAQLGPTRAAVGADSASPKAGRRTLSFALPLAEDLEDDDDEDDDDDDDDDEEEEEEMMGKVHPYRGGGVADRSAVFEKSNKMKSKIKNQMKRVNAVESNFFFQKQNRCQ